MQFKLDNELDLVYAAVFQKVIKLNYLDSFLTEMQLAFKEKFGGVAEHERLGIDYEFEEEFRSVLSAAEETSAKQGKAPKAMRSYNESQKSKKTVASMIQDDKKSSSNDKRVNIQESPPAPKSQPSSPPRTNADIIQENRRKLREKLTPTKKAATEAKPQKNNGNVSEKAGKKPRVWDLGGNSKDAAMLDRSKDAPEDVQVQSINNEVSNSSNCNKNLTY